MPALSILIPSMHKRRGLLNRLIASIGFNDEVEILTDVDSGEVTTGNKRNRLIKRAKGTYIVFIDDDDAISCDYIPSILEAITHDPDVITFNGWMTTDNVARIDFRIGLGFPYTAVNYENKIIYLRYPNHLCPIKRTIAEQVLFPNATFGEDYKWATDLKDRQLLKKEYRINKFLYHYQYKTIKP